MVFVKNYVLKKWFKGKVQEFYRFWRKKNER